MFSYKKLTDPDEIRSAISRIRFDAVLDTETTDKDPTKAELIDIQISGPEGIICFSAEHVAALASLGKGILLIGQNLGYDLHVLYRHGLDLRNYSWRDTMLLHHLVNECESHSLDANVQKLWQDPYKEQFWSKYSSYLEAPEEERDIYACKDIYYTELWYDHLQEQLLEQEIPESLIERTHSLARYLLDTEILGVRIDKAYLMEKMLALRVNTEILLPKMRGLVETACQMVECDEWVKLIDKYKSDKGKANVKSPVFNFDSSKQLCNLLYKQLKLPEQQNEKTKKLSTDYDCLEKIRDQHPVVPLIQEYRDYHKTIGTLDGILERMLGDNIYPTFNINGTKTGRISHADPNLGNMPKEGGIRGLFLPDLGHCLISADYSGLEVVVEANLTDDKNLAKIVMEGASKHTITAEALGVSRDIAKTLNFACQYWCTSYKVAKILGVGPKEGQRIHTRYWELYAGPKQLKEVTDKEVDELGVVVNMFSRRRRFGIKRRSSWDKDYRAAYNFKVQGPGAELTNEATFLVGARLKSLRRGRLLWSVHDELIISVKQEHAEEESFEMVRIMESLSTKYKFKYPLKAVSSGPMDRWEDK